jgi:sterol desaturase/sphingolipid hydroxylase (fatty acid hydroxylase superfamily)
MVITSWAVGLTALVLERVRPATLLPTVRGWTFRSRLFILLEILTVAFVALLGLFLYSWLGLSPIFNLADLSLAAQVTINFVVSSFVFYWWHRLRHESDFWWLATHQLHHSASRIETVTAFFKHPLEVGLDTLLNLALSFVMLGVCKEAFIAHTALIASSQFFVHMNVSTPQWVGYFIQRPEMHRIHHQYDVHKNNYSDLPLWDYLFGTYSNPPNVVIDCGFTAEREQQLRNMLRFEDVHKN